jgi:hypothetical protein
MTSRATTLRGLLAPLHRRRFRQGVVAAALFFGWALVRPVAAEAQARGTLQVSAQVVDTKVSSAGLRAAHSALRAFALTSPALPSHDAVTTVARVTVAYAPDRRPGIVVTIDYSKN